jgi:hypothetical protein
VAFALAHTQKKPLPVSQRSETPVPAGLEAIVMQLLEKDPANRVGSAQELARRLRLLQDVPDWCPDRAAQWWETNLPEISLRASTAETVALTPATASVTLSRIPV